MKPQTPLDGIDQAILAHRTTLFWRQDQHPRVGDYIDFADGVTRRVSHVWDREDGLSYQTSEGGSFYLGEGYLSFSGGLYPAIPGQTLTRTPERRDGAVWFFHHNILRAGNGVESLIPCAVYRCSLSSAHRVSAH